VFSWLANSFFISHLQATVSRTGVGSVSRGTSWPLLAMGYPSRPSLALRVYVFSFFFRCGVPVSYFLGVFLLIFICFFFYCVRWKEVTLRCHPLGVCCSLCFFFSVLGVWCLGVIVFVSLSLSLSCFAPFFSFLLLEKGVFWFFFIATQLVCLGPFREFSVLWHLFLSFFFLYSFLSSLFSKSLLVSIYLFFFFG